MTRNFVPFSWGIATGIGVCVGWSIVGYFAALGGLPKFFSMYAKYLWPSSLFFFPALEQDPALFVLVLVASVGVNALLYGCIFVLIRIIVRVFYRRKSNV